MLSSIFLIAVTIYNNTCHCSFKWFEVFHFFDKVAKIKIESSFLLKCVNHRALPRLGAVQPLRHSKTRDVGMGVREKGAEAFFKKCKN